MVPNSINNNRRLLPEEPDVWDLFFKRLKIWGVAVFFSIWSFILGILVGRETLSLQIVKHDLQKDMVLLRQEEVQKKEEKIQHELTLERTQTDLAYPDMLKDRKVDAGEQKNAPAQPFAASEKQGKEVKDPKKKADLPKTSIILKPLPKDESAVPSPEKRLTIQIASYKDSADADKMIAKLKDKGYTAYKASADVGGKAWHRIRIGYFKDKAEADPIQQRLKKDNFSPILINAD